ncbi:MAG: MipA/OmpV family protein, partial [Kangiellaceae bacterium]|nr:MipA/OmpV family protein [Kangiellaceae bacterium]
MSRITNHTLAIFILFFFGLQSCNAMQANNPEDVCDSTDDNCTEVGEWNFGIALGLGGRSNPVVDGSNIPFVLLPSFSYYGKRFFINNLDIGYTLNEGKNSTINLISTPSYD